MKDLYFTLVQFLYSWHSLPTMHNSKPASIRRPLFLLPQLPSQSIFPTSTTTSEVSPSLLGPAGDPNRIDLTCHFTIIR